MANLLINRGIYRRLRQAALLPFAENCCARVLDHPAYTPVQALAQILRDQCSAYSAALQAAANRALDTVARKDQARRTLTVALDRLAAGLEEHAAGDPVYLTNAGFTIREVPRPYTSKPPETPQHLRLRPGATSGQAILQFDGVNGAYMYAVEWQNGPGEAWQNGYYTSRRRTVLHLPARQENWVRVRAIGSGNRCSPWSAVVAAYIP